MPRNPALDVFCNARLAGSLGRSQVEEGDFLFGYARECPPQDAVSLTMPVVRDQYDSMGTVHPVFEMNLPEGVLRERLRARFAKILPEFDDLALLGIVGRSQIGRLRYAQPGAAPVEPPAENLRRLLTYKGAEDLFEDLLAKTLLSDNRRLLLVERFDLRADGTCLGLEDFCVLNGLRSHGRYEGSYELLARPRHQTDKCGHPPLCQASHRLRASRRAPRGKVHARSSTARTPVNRGRANQETACLRRG